MGYKYIYIYINQAQVIKRCATKSAVNDKRNMVGDTRSTGLGAGCIRSFS